jgi:hypothetical protein
MGAMPLSAPIVRLGLVGAFAGLVAWLTVLDLHLLCEVSRPSWVALLHCHTAWCCCGRALGFGASRVLEASSWHGWEEGPVARLPVALG